MSSGLSPVNAVLSFPAAGYFAVQKVRETAYRWGVLSQRKAPVPVMSVGNLLLGGAGKTPFVIFLAGLLSNRRLKPAVVSRGYRGSSRAPYLVVGDGSSGEPLVGPDVCGDEPYLIARRLPDVPVIVGRKRIYPVKAAHELFGCNVVVLDDGFQHLPLKRDADIVLLNGSEDHMFPWGRLREPLSALRRADIVMLTAGGTIPVSAVDYVRGPIFNCRPVPSGLASGANLQSLVPSETLSGREVILASGIANPERFRDTAEKLGWIVVDHYSLPDHHRFTDKELQSILDRASGLPVVVTEKDWVKLPAWFKEIDQVAALRIEMVLDDEEAFWTALASLVPTLSHPGTNSLSKR
jgi:tetraacyldisaccharide 4'-kinase